MRGRGLPVSRSAWSMSGPRRQLNTPRPEDRNPPEVARIVGSANPSATEPAVPQGIGAQGTEEVDPSEVRPERVTEVELRVRALPEHEATQALFTRGADDEVGVGLALGVEVVGNVLDVEQCRDLFQGRALRGVLVQETPDGVRD